MSNQLLFVWWHEGGLKIPGEDKNVKCKQSYARCFERQKYSRTVHNVCVAFTNIYRRALLYIITQVIIHKIYLI